MKRIRVDSIRLVTVKIKEAEKERQARIKAGQDVKEITAKIDNWVKTVSEMKEIYL